MNIEVVNTAFAGMIRKKAVHEKLGITANAVYQLRSQLKNGLNISIDKKLELLKKSGWKEEEVAYSRADLVRLVKFTLKSSAKAREFGAEYLVEKWEAENKS